MRSFLHICVILILVQLDPIQVLSQRCPSAIKRNLLIKDPVNQAKWTSFLTSIENTDKDILSTRAVITIPVVVHVLWRTSDQNISDEQIYSQIEVLNEDFRLDNWNFNLTPSVFADVAADVELEFCLAGIDPTGQKTDGIIRRQVSERYIGSGSNYYSTARGGSDGWDVNRYINIWICELADGSFGFSTFPLMADPPESEGIVVQSQYFGNTGTAATSSPQHLGRTMTHELGHYFGLEHVWGPDLGGCSEDDFVEDTPLQELESEGCPSFPLRDICSPRTPGVMFYNYMDYTDDSCMTMFTQGQKERMLAVLTMHRTPLTTSNGCGTVAAEDIQSLDDLFYPNPFNTWITLGTYGKDGTVMFFNVHGENVKTTYFNHSEKSRRIDTEGLPCGLYFLRLETENSLYLFKALKHGQ